jgi:hypothetical protein
MNVAEGSKAAVAAGLLDVGLPPDSGGIADIPQQRLGAISGLMQRSKLSDYSVNSLNSPTSLSTEMVPPLLRYDLAARRAVTKNTNIAAFLLQLGWPVLGRRLHQAPIAQRSDRDNTLSGR